MNPGGQNGQHDGASNYHPFAYTFNTATQGNHEHDASRQALMNEEQQAMMDKFWDQPDQAPTINNNEITTFNFLGSGLNDKNADGSLNAFGLHMPNSMDFSLGTGTNDDHMSMPYASAPRTVNHMAPPYLSQYDASKGFEGFLCQNEQPPTSTTQQRITHDDQAASALMSMSSHSQEHSQATAASGASWGNLNINHSTGNYADDQFSMAGEPSSTSSNTPLTPTVAEGFQGLGRSASHAQFQPHSLMQQATQASNYAASHARHPSLPMHSNNNHMFRSPTNSSWGMPQAIISQNQNQNQSQHRPHMYQYGSDENFSQQGYQGANYSTQNEKYTNLMNLPLASAAAREPYAPIAAAQQAGRMRDDGQQHRHSLPNNLQQLSSAALAHQDAAVPPTSSAFQQASNHFPSTQAMENLDVSQQFRKRRRSQAEDDSAMTYGQNGTQTAVESARRASIAPKHETAGDNYQAGYVTPPGTATKRRRTSPAASATASASPSTPAATAIRPSSSSKKRRADTKQPRHNLSDSQKRNNHIASEQKRRDAMKTNYLELNVYVPTLTQGAQGLSRSEILQHSGDWLETLKIGNNSIMAAYGLTFDDVSDAIIDGQDGTND